MGGRQASRLVLWQGWGVGPGAHSPSWLAQPQVLALSVQLCLALQALPSQRRTLRRWQVQRWVQLGVITAAWDWGKKVEGGSVSHARAETQVLGSVQTVAERTQVSRLPAHPALNPRPQSPPGSPPG